MLDLASSLGRTRGANAPPPLPTVFRRLEDRKVAFRRGQLSMIAAASGVGKTLFAQWLAVHAHVPTLFFSADTDETTMAERAAAMLVNVHQEEVRMADSKALQFYADRLSEKAQHISWDFDSDHTVDSIDDTIKAFGLVYGEWPALIVFDVLMSYQTAAGDWAAMNEFILNAKAIASSTQAHVMLLHHTVGAYADKTEAPPKSSIMNKNDQLLSTVLTIGRDNDAWNLAVVKNRNGPSDPRAESPLRYSVDFSRMQITEPERSHFF